MSRNPGFTWPPSPDNAKAPSGHGVDIRWLCMGCNRSRPQAGAKGTGVRRRCADCLATKGARHGAR